MRTDVPPPADLAAEQSVLRAWVSDSVFRRAWKPEPELFFGGMHRTIAEIMARRAGAKRFGEHTLIGELQRAGQLKGEVTRDTVLNAVGGPLVADPWGDVERIRELAALRALRHELAEAHDSITSDTRLHTVQGRVRAAEAASVDAMGIKLVTAKDLAHSVHEHITSRRPISYCTTCYQRIDRVTGGIRPGDGWVLRADSSWGKCLGGDIQVLMADGSSVAASDVQLGDKLMGADSQPRQVLSLTRGHGPMYRIVTLRGAAWTCNGAHVLVVVSTRTGVVTEISVENFLRKTPTWRSQQKQFHVGVEYPRRGSPPIDPWFAGVWYGDGTKDLVTVAVTTPDREIVGGLQQTAKTYGLHVRKNGKPGNAAATYSLAVDQRFTRNPLLRALRQLWCDGSSLPECLLRGSRRVRLEFLAGFIDSDGYRKGDRFCEIVTQYAAWADQLRILARSLGLQAYIYTKTGIPGYESRVYYRVHIFGDLSVIPTRVARKRFPNTANAHRLPNRTGFTVEPLGDGDFFGWRIEGDGRFLLDDFTVTHNSTYATAVVDENIDRGKRVLLVTNEDTPELFGRRIACRRARVRYSAMRDRKLDQFELGRVQREIIGLEQSTNLWVVKAVGKSIERICGVIRSAIRIHRLNLVVLDYAQKLWAEAKTENRERALVYCAERFADTCKEDNAASLLLSQMTLNAQGENRTKGAGAIKDNAETLLEGRSENRAGVITKTIRCVKVKEGRAGGEFEVEWDDDSASFVADVPRELGLPDNYDEE